MSKKSVFSALLLAGAMLALAGCSKKGDAAADAAAAPAPLPGKEQASGTADIIPGEKDFRAALAEKNYSGAVERLLGMESLLASPEQRDHWAILFGELRSTLSDASSKDPKAAEALLQLRSARNGR